METLLFRSMPKTRSARTTGIDTPTQEANPFLTRKRLEEAIGPINDGLFNDSKGIANE